jgi:hypothetical protein
MKAGLRNETHVGDGKKKAKRSRSGSNHYKPMKSGKPAFALLYALLLRN